MSKNYLKTIGEELLPAIAYGDAAGLPVETRSHQQITERYGALTHLIPCNENPFYVGEFTSGTWSDDTQLSMAVARALVRAKGFNMTTIADEHVHEYAQTPQIVKESGQVIKRGWGGSTTRAVERYMAGVPWQECGEKGGAGNGVIMKMGPLAYWLIAHEVPDSIAYRQLDTFTAFTHDSPEARIATRLHYAVLKDIVTTSSLIDFGTKTYTKALAIEAEIQGHAGEITSALRPLLAGAPADTIEILHRTDGKGFFVPQTLAMAYNTFLLHEGEFTSSVYEAVNLGGDTDSTASIVATMSLFKESAVKERPEDFMRTLNYDELVQLSHQLVEAATEDFK